MAIIADLMKTQMVTANPDESVVQVAQRMRDNAVGAVLLLKGDQLAGLFSERDLLMRVVAPGKDPHRTRVGQVATREVVTVDEGTHIRQCAAIFRERGFRHLPVTRQGRPVGILSVRDFFSYVVEGLEGLIDQMRYQKSLDAGEDPYDHIGAGHTD